MATSRRPGASPPRAAWVASEIPTCLDRFARRDLIAANRHFEVESRLDELEQELRVLVAEPRRLDLSSKDRRAELAELEQTIQALRVTLASLHPRSRHALIGVLGLWRWQPDFIRKLRHALQVLRLACAESLTEVPKAGNPSRGRRDAVIRAVCTWLDRLGPHPTRSGGVAKLGLTDKTRSLETRRRESVKIVCRALQLPFDGDWNRIIATALSKESATKSR